MEVKHRAKGGPPSGPNPSKSSNICNQLPLNTLDPNTAGYVFVLNKTAPLVTRNYLLALLSNEPFKMCLISSSEIVSMDDDLTLVVTCEASTLNQHASKVYMHQQLSRQLPDPNALDKGYTLSEQERILLHVLESIVQKERKLLVGFPHLTLYPGQSIIQICHREQIILDYFPLHQKEVLKCLKSNWASSFVNDIDAVRNYFGEKIGFYFSFLNFYTSFFMYASVVCLISFLLGDLLSYVNELATIVLSVSLFVFLKMWKRQSNRLACKWGTIEAFDLNSARPSFRSKGMQPDAVTGEPVPFYPIAKTWAKEYLISVPCVLACLLISFQVMCFYFDAENWALEYYNSAPSLLSNLVSYFPSIIYSLIVMLMNRSYRVFATRLNDYENHRTQISHENHWIVKLVLFEFVNNFMSLFYIAFYLQDIAMLRWNLVTMLTINQLVDNLLETVLPLSTIYFSKLSIVATKKNDLNENIAKVEHEKGLCEYEDTYYDYLELFVQYGYAFLFVAIFPLAPVIACINSVVEVRLDAIKLCVAMRKPRQRSAKSVNNGWMKSFEVLSILVVMSNLMVLSIASPLVQQMSSHLNLSNFEFIIYTEHAIFSVILLLWYIVPDIPKEVNLSLSRQKYSNIKQVSDRQQCVD